jgi:hypothetical protein
MQDNHIGRKFMGLAPADTARLPLSTNTKKIVLVVKNLVWQAGTTPTLNCLALEGTLYIFDKTFFF